MKNKSHNPAKSNLSASRNNGGIYEIKVKGLLDAHWQQWFEGMTLKYQEPTKAGGQDCTLIIGPIVDQPALHGLLAKIRDLNLTLISVRKINSDCLDDSEGNKHVEPKNPPNRKRVWRGRKANS